MPNRSAVVAGQFYPGSKDRLTQAISHYLDANHQTENGLSSKVWAVMLPHAGYVYCGNVIGRTLAHTILPKKLFILSPNHTGLGTPFSVWPDGVWSTPLGEVKVDSHAAEELIATNTGFQADTMAHLREHSIETLLPFLQYINPGLEIVPITIGTQNETALQKAATGLASVLRRPENRDMGIIVSSDMNHYENFETTHYKDKLALNEIMAMKPENLLATVKKNHISMCGAAPMALAMMTALQLGDFEAEICCHDTSGSANGDYNQVVGYAGAKIYPQPAAV